MLAPQHRFRDRTELCLVILILLSMIANML